MFKHPPPQNLLRSAFTHEHSFTVYAAFWYVNIYNVVINFTSRQGWRAYAEGCLLCVRCIHSPVLVAPSFLSGCEQVENDTALQWPARVY